MLAPLVCDLAFGAEGWRAVLEALAGQLGCHYAAVVATTADRTAPRSLGAIGITTEGKLLLADPDAGRVPLVSRVEIDARVLSGQDVLKHVSASAELFGNGGATSSSTDNFQLLSDGFDLQIGDFIINLDSSLGSNEVGATLQLRPLNIPVDLSNIVDGTPITISVALNGEVRAPGAETIASAFFRDPTQVDNPDPLLGGSTITFDTGSGSGTSIPEASTSALLGPVLLALWACGWRRRGPSAA
jgi:hypothetical protein